MPRVAHTKYYAVKIGRVPGVYTSWAECESQVKGYPGPRFKKFATLEEAQKFAGIAPDSSHSGKSTPSAAMQQSKLSSSQNDPVVSSVVRPAPKETNDKKIKRQFPLPNFTPTNDPGTVVVYTDGASSNNGKASARAGVGVYWGPNDSRNVSEPLEGLRQTNQRAELTAVIRALEQALNVKEVLEIRTDSKYVINAMDSWVDGWLKNKWRAANGKDVQNRDLFERLVELRSKRAGKTKFVHVNGHSGEPGNEMADRLAVLGAQMGS